MKASRVVVLVAEDEELVRNMLAVMIRNDGHDVLIATDGAEALEVSRRYDGHIDLLVSDVCMPKMNGIDLAQLLAAERPGIKVLLLSGTLGLNIPAAFQFLQKPFRVVDMRHSVAELLAITDPKKGSSAP